MRLVYSGAGTRRIKIGLCKKKLPAALLSDYVFATLEVDVPRRITSVPGGGRRATPNEKSMLAIE